MAQPRKKQVKDQGEHDLYNQALIDVADPAKEVHDLDLWTQKYPDSDYKDDRLYLYLQAYHKMDPPRGAAVLEYGERLMTRGLQEAFASPGGGMNILNVLFLVAWHAAAMTDANAAQLALGKRAARELLEFAPKHFVPENRPSDVTGEQWGAARADIEARAHTALSAIALAPGNQAMAKDPSDCAAAETAYTKALGEYPQDAHISYALGKALSCRGLADPEEAAGLYSRSIYQFVRAAVVDPSLGAGDYSTKLYAMYHGSEDGLAALREQAKAAPLAPSGFTIGTAAEAAAAAHAEPGGPNAPAAAWKTIRDHLVSTEAFQYFNGQLKDTNLALHGQLVEGRPACRPKELLVAMPNSEASAARAEITLRLDSALSGAAVPGEIDFEGTAKLFTKEPLMLTLDTSGKRIAQLKTAACR